MGITRVSEVQWTLSLLNFVKRYFLLEFAFADFTIEMKSIKALHICKFLKIYEFK